MFTLRKSVVVSLVSFLSIIFQEAISQGTSPVEKQVSKPNHSSIPCDKNPKISCPPNVTLCIGANTHPDGTGCAKAIPGGINCDPPIVNYVDKITSEGPCKGEKIIQRIWTAVDPNDETIRSFCIQYIHLEDKESPNLHGCPKDTSVFSNDKCFALLSWKAPSFSDNCSNFCVKSSHPNGSTFSIGNTKVTFTATDECGNSITCSFTINVKENCCNLPPIISCPKNFTGCPQGADPDVIGKATAIAANPNCGSPIISYKDDTIFFSKCSIRIDRKWSAVDPKNTSLTSSCVQKIDLFDTQIPSITCPSNITVNSGPDCKAIVNWNTPVTSDNCSNVSLVSSHQSGTSFKVGTTTIYYTAFDACGNSNGCSFTITVEEDCCNKPPVVLCPADFNGCPQGIEPSVTGVGSALKASNFCTPPVITYEDSTIFHLGCSLRVSRKWIATDTSLQLFSICRQIIDLKDTQEPSITCPPNLTITSDPDCTVNANWSSPSTSDNCSAVTLSSSHQNGSRFNVGEYTIFYTATDACGNSKGCNFKLTVQANCCDKPPVVLCPADFSGCPQGIDPAVTGKASALKGSKFCTVPMLSFADKLIHSQPCSVNVERTWTALDTSTKLSASCIQKIDLKDAQAPTLTIPDNLTVQSGADCMAIVNWSNPTTSDNCTNVNVTSSHPNGSKFAIGETKVTYTATDLCGNSVSKSFTITVTDNCCDLPPIIICATRYVGCPGSSIDPSVTGRPTVNPGSSRCGNTLVGFKDEVLITSSCSTLIKRIWTAVDSFKSELKSSCEQFIELKDTINPIITCPTNIRILSTDSCVAIVEWNEPIVMDNCGNTTFSSSHESGAELPIGKTTVFYTVFDACGNSKGCNFEIDIIDNCCNEAPKVKAPVDFKGCPQGIDPAVTGRAIITSDPACGKPIVTYTDQLIFSAPCSLVVKRTWLAIDSAYSELRDSADQLIVLSDTQAPALICPANSTSLSDENCKARVRWSDPSTSDNCSNVNLISSHTSGDMFSIGVTTITYTGTDACGNKGTCSFDITVVSNCCDKGPKITCPANFVGCPGSTDPGRTGNPTYVKGAEKCGEPIITYADNVIFSNSCSTRINRTWLAVDPSKNLFRDSCVQEIDLHDKVEPIVVNCPSNIEIVPGPDCKGVANWTVPTAIDNCNLISMTGTHLSGSTFNVGKTLIVYTATDACGNTSSCSFNVDVLDQCCNKPPIITCPSNYKACPGSNTGLDVTGRATAIAGNSFCGTPVIGFTVRVISEGPCVNARVFERIWSATDPDFSNNVSTCVQRIELSDDVNPVIPKLQDIKVDTKGKCEVSVNWVAPIATDNCTLMSLVSSHASGDIFAVGTTKVTYTATDLCGNTSSMSFNVIVSETFISIDCPLDTIVQRTNANLNGAYVKWPIPTVTHCKTCKDTLPGFVYMGEYAGIRYFCSLSPANWLDAKTICKINGGNLAKIRNKEENQFISSKLMGQTAWIGANDERREGNFEWVDGSQVTYFNWATGQPNNGGGNEDYVELHPDGSWNDNRGNVSREFICQIPCYNIQQTAGPESGSPIPCGSTKITYVASKDGHLDTCSFNIEVKCDSISKYCNNTGKNTDILWIDRVSFANVENVSGDNKGYAYFNNICGVLRNGQVYDLCVEPGFKTGVYVVYWKVWIDFNSDGVFQSSELILIGQGSTGLCGKFALPAGYVPGFTRMRVVMSYGKHAVDACSFILYGEVEDYCIDLRKVGSSIINPNNLDNGNKTGQLKCIKNCENSRPVNTIEEFLNNRNSSSLIEIIPNPAREEVKIKLINRKISSLNIYDLNGKLVWRKVPPISQLEVLDVSQWNEGVYSIIIQFEDDQSSTDKLVIYR
ncbi:MAG: HYR domain-containing protein [Saprospiraceae bacterium]|nr:HYR domain-containing protein [Saprospiraceae bacterium]